MKRLKKNDPYAEGSDAALAGESITDNPYPRGSSDEASWNDGFMSVEDEE